VTTATLSLSLLICVSFSRVSSALHIKSAGSDEAPGGKDSIVPHIRTIKLICHITGKMKVMRPLVHPSVEDITVEGILHALSDPVRVAIYADIVGASCSQNCSSFLKVNEKPIHKSTLSQHF